jgi:chromosome segregation ATPase
MKNALALLAMVTICGSAAVKGDAPASRPSNTARAYREVRIDAPDAYLEVVQDFEKNCLGDFDLREYSLPQYPPDIQIEKSAVNDAPILRISVDTARGGEFHGDAASIADEIVRELGSRLAMLTQQRRAIWKSEVDAESAKSKNLQTERIVLENEIKLLIGARADAVAESGLADPSPQSVRELSHTLEAELEATAVDVEGKTARQQALADAIAKLSDDVAARIRTDAVAEQLQQVVSARQEELDDLQGARAGNPAISADQVDRAVAAVAEAKAAVLERREAAANAAGAATIQKWNSDLLSLSVDLAELHARMKTLRSRLERLAKAIQMTEAVLSLDSLNKSLDELESQIRNLAGTSSQRDLGEDQPKLTVLESRDEPATN